MARCLIIGCGCRGRLLAAELVGRGHAVRASTRDARRLAAIDAAGAEGVVGDPDRIVTLVSAFEHVAVAYILLAGARGTPEEVSALHGERLDMLLHRMVDTTVRGIVYEARGPVDPGLLDRGAALVRAVCGDARIPYVVLDADPSAYAGWVRAAADAADRVLSGRG